MLNTTRLKGCLLAAGATLLILGCGACSNGTDPGVNGTSPSGTTTAVDAARSGRDTAGGRVGGGPSGAGPAGSQ